MRTERDPTLSEFYSVVDIKIETDALEMIAESRNAQHRAEKCGCPQCQKYANRMKRKCEEEAWRITGQPAMDHEEKILMNIALGKIDLSVFTDFES